MTESRHSFEGRPVGSTRAQAATDVGVVVVSYQSASTLEACLRRLLAATSVPRVIAVDNASSDGSAAIVARLAATEPRLQLVRNNHNRGFGAACNQGASALDTPWIAFVNPDCFVEPDTLLRLVGHGIASAGAGLLGVEQRDPDGRADPASRRRDPSLRAWFARAGRRDDDFLARDPAEVLQAVDAVSGALMLLPLGLFLQLAGFDEGFRLHGEDLDLCRRVRAAGYEVLVANDLAVTHERGVSSRARPAWVEWQKHRSLWRYFNKFEAAHTPRWQRGLLWSGLWAHGLFACARAVLAGARQR